VKVFVITMDDPVQTIPFIKKVIEARKNWIAGVAIVRGDRLTIRKKQSRLEYLVSLLLIMGIFHFLKNSFITLSYKVLKKFGWCSSKISQLTFKGWVELQGIPVMGYISANDTVLLDTLRELNVDVIINQSQAILKPELLSIPSIGVINRHNALLPKNRGRLTPFWVLYKNEKETGVSIHFVTDKLDAGDIIVQKRFEVLPSDTFNRLVRKNYSIAHVAMIEALDLLASGNYHLTPNSDNESTYNSTPRLIEAINYRLKRLKRNFRPQREPG